MEFSFANSFAVSSWLLELMQRENTSVKNRIYASGEQLKIVIYSGNRLLIMKLTNAIHPHY